MATALPTEDLSPVEGATPTDAVVQPTNFGLNAASDALGHAATVGYRAAAIATRAQAQEDARAVAPLVTTVQGALSASLIQGMANNQAAAPGFVSNMQAAGQKVIDSFDPQIAQLPPGQRAQVDRAMQEALVSHQANALRVQNAHQETAVEDDNKSQRLNLLNTALTPAVTKMQGLDKGLAATAAGDPRAGEAYRAGSAEAAANAWSDYAANSGLPQWQLDDLKPQYDLEIAQEQLRGAGRISDAQAAYGPSHLISGVANNLNANVAAVESNPALYGPMTAPGGQYEKNLAPLGTGKTADDAKTEYDQKMAQAYITGLKNEGQSQLALSELNSGKLDAALGDKKIELENDLAKFGPNAIARDTTAAGLALREDQDLAHRAAEGGSIYSPADQATMQQAMSPEAWATYQARAQVADQTFAKLGGVPISQMTKQQLQAVPQPPDSSAPDYQAGHDAWMGAQAQLAALQQDPAAMVLGQARTGVATPGGARPAKGEMGALGAKVAGELQALPLNGQADVAAGTAYARDQLQAQANFGLDPRYDRLRVLPKAVAEARVAALDAAPPQDKLNALMGLRSFVNSLPDNVKIADGTTFSPKSMAMTELMDAHLKPGDVAAMIYSAAPGGQVGLGRYAGAISDPDLKKPLPKQDGEALLSAVNGSLKHLIATNQTPGDKEMTPGIRDYVYAQARFLMAQNPGWSPQYAADQAAPSVTGGFKYDHALRMPLALAQQQYGGGVSTPLAEQAAAIGAVTGLSLTRPRTGWDSAYVGMDQAKNWVLGNNGANLAAPSSAMGAKDGAAGYAGQVRTSGFWTNYDDGHVALVVPRPDGQVEYVKDRYKRPIVMSFQQAMADGQSGHSVFETAPPMALRTPQGHPVNAAPPPVAAAAAAGAIAGAPAPAPASAPPPAPPGTVGTAGTPGTATVAQPPLAQTAATGAAPEQAMNATQQALQAVGASPRVLAMFAGGEAAGAPSAGGAGVDASYERLNVTPTKAVQLLLPQVEHIEHGAGGAVSPKGALGLMQLMPDTIKEWAPRLGIAMTPDLVERVRTDPKLNLAIGTALLNHLTAHYMTGGNPQAGIALALAAYNAGPGRVEGGVIHGQHYPGWLTSIGDPRAGGMTVDQWISRIPYAETRNYVRTVMDRTTQRLAAVVGSGPPGG